MPNPTYARPPYAPTRFPKGITNANITENLANLGQLDPTKIQTGFVDFINDLGGLTATTTALNAGAGGQATITAAGNVIGSLSFVPVAGKRAFFKARISTATVATGSLTVGLVNATTPTQGIYITILNGTATLTVQNGSGNVTAVKTGLSYGAASMFTLGWELLPSGLVKMYFNDAFVGITANATYLPTATNLGMFAAAATANGVVDYLFAAVER